MLCQGPLQRRSVTCSRAALGHNRYFCLSSATFSKHAAVCTTPQPSACRLASALQNAKQRLQRQKKGENRRAASLKFQEQDNALPHRHIRGRLSEVPHQAVCTASTARHCNRTPRSAALKNGSHARHRGRGRPAKVRR